MNAHDIETFQKTLTREAALWTSAHTSGTDGFSAKDVATITAAQRRVDAAVAKLEATIAAERARLNAYCKSHDIFQTF